MPPAPPPREAQLKVGDRLDARARRSAPAARASAISRSAARGGIRSPRLIWQPVSPASSATATSCAVPHALGHPVDQPGQPLALAAQL